MSELKDQLQRTLGDNYSLERELGGGGMSRVFVAEETSLGRKVVVKVLPPDLAASVNVERFRREIQLAAKLQHPLIVPVLAAGISDGLPYYTMPFIEGESLRARISRTGELPIHDAVRIMRDMLSALSYAHEHGVVHRDIKPDNVLLTGQHAVVADFGVAKAISASTNPGASLTSLGVALGTPAYMAPEQAAADPTTDHRADLYAVGAVAYEMLTGQQVFSARSPQAMLAAHVSEAPEPIQKRRATVPPALASLIMRALEKHAADRPQSAAEMLAQLDAAVTPSGATTPHTGSMPARKAGSSSRSIWMVAGGAALLLLLGSSGWYWRAHSRWGGAAAAADAAGVALPAAGISTVAVLPFSSTGGVAKDEYFSDGMTDELAHALSRLPSVRVAARTSSYAFKGKSAPVQEIGKVLNVAGVIEGTVRRAGDRLRVTAQLTSAADGLVLWSGTYESRGRDVFQIQDSLTKAIVGAIAPALRGEKASTVASASRGTENAEAYDLYLKGHYFWAKRGAANLNRAIGYFKEAIAKDPAFARAHAGLAMVYVVLPGYTATNADSIFTLGIQSGTRALGIDSTLADAHMAIALALTSEFKLTEAARYFESAIRLEPGNATAHLWYGVMFRFLGDEDNDVAELRRAAELDPLSPVIGGNLANSYYVARRMPEAIAQARRVLEIDSTVYTATYSSLGLAYLFSGKPDSALVAFETEYRLNPEVPGSRGRMVLGYAATGRWQDAERIRAAISRERGPAADNDRLFSDLAFGDWDGAISTLERAKKGGYLGAMSFSLGCDPLFDPLKASPRFAELTSQLGIRVCKPIRPWPIKVPGNLLGRPGGPS